MTFTLNDDSSANKTDCVGKEQVIGMFKRHQHDYRLIDGCFHKNFEFHVSSSFSKQKKLTCSRKQKLPYFDDVQLFRKKQQCDYRLNDGCFHKNLAIHLINSFLKIIFIQSHSNLNAICCNGFCNSVL